MEKVKEIEVRACKDTAAGCVHWVPEDSAEYFSVYGGGAGYFGWVADFADKLDALNFGKARAMRLGAEFVNRIGVL